MQKPFLQPLRPPVVPFSEFLAALFQAFEGEGLHPFILRNYEGFPTDNLGNDVDFLIRRRDLPHAMRALRSVGDVRVVNYSELSFISSVFLEGTSAIPGARSIQVDFFWSLCFRGLPYISTDVVLQAEMPRRAGDLSFFVPSPVHEAIISLCTSLVHSAYLKEKYLPQVQHVFASHKREVIAALLPKFGLDAATHFVDLVIAGDHRKIIDFIRPLRIALGLRGLLHKPFHSTLAIARYYVGQFNYLYSPKSIETVCILGPCGCGKTKLIEALAPLLRSSAKEIEERDLETRFPLWSRSPRATGISDSDAKARRSSFGSMATIAALLVQEWRALLVGRRILTLRICNRYYHDLLIDPTRYGYNGPMWFARLVGKLFPIPDLWMLMDAPADAVQSMNPQMASAEIQSQIDAYRAFITTRKRYVILDAAKPLADVTEDAYGAIIDTLALRADRRLRRRFYPRFHPEP